jgi:hypothetical protein
MPGHETGGPSIPAPQGGRFWTRKGGHVWMRFDIVATKMLKALYGDRLMSDFASLAV